MADYEGVTHAGIAVVARDSGRVLMQQRAWDETDAEDVRGTWEFPGGGLEEGEDPETGAWREFCEETGCPKPEGEIVNGWRSGNGVYQGFVYAVPVEQEAFATLNPEEADTANPDDPNRMNPDVTAWFTVEQAQGLGAALRPEVRDQMDWSLLDLEAEMTETAARKWFGVIAPEGVKSGDKRMFSPGALRMRSLPLPLTWQKVSAPGHEGNITVAMIQESWRENGLIWGAGEWLDTPEADEAYNLVDKFGRYGVSVDADDLDEFSIEIDDDGTTVFTDARQCSACIVSIPAFAEAFVMNGDYNDFKADFAGGWGAPSQEIPTRENEGQAECEERDEDGNCIERDDEEEMAEEPVAEEEPKECDCDGDPECVCEEDEQPEKEKPFAVSTVETCSDCVENVPFEEWNGEQVLGMVAAADIGLGSEISMKDLAPGLTEDGPVGTFQVWNVVHQSPSTTSTIGPMTTSAGPGRATSTAPGTDESPSVVARLVVRTGSPPIGSSTSAGLAPFPTTSSSTTFVGTAPASTPGISNPSLTERMSPEGTSPTDGAPSVATDSMTSLTPSPGTSGLSMEFGSGRVVPVTSLDAASGTARLSDGTVLVNENFGPTSNPSTMDGPGWLTHPVDTDRLRDYWVRGPGAAKIGWGTPDDFYRCEAAVAEYVKPQYIKGYCANRHYDALGYWPGQAPHKGEAIAMSTIVNGIEVGEEEEPLALTAGAPMKNPPKVWFEDPGLPGVTPLTVTQEGRVFGHLATWGQCHIGIGGECVMLPKSASDYSYFHIGVVETDGGEVFTGPLVMGGKHAGDRLDWRAATRHYDTTSAVIADIRVGHDEYGVWMSGALRDGVTEEQIREIKAAGKASGDWREVVRGSRQLELIAALAVNVGGFPVPRTRITVHDGRVVSLVAAGIVEDDPIGEIAEEVALRLEARQEMKALRAEVYGSEIAALGEEI